MPMGPISTELAYLAGYFDADGSIAITRQKNRNGHFIHQIKAVVTSISPMIPETFQKHWGGSLIVLDWNNKQNPKNRIRCDWQITSKKCKLFLDEIGPFIRFRKDQIKVALELQSSLDLYPGGIKPWDKRYETVMEYRFGLYQRIRELKKFHYLEGYRDGGEFGEHLSASKGRIGRPRAKQDAY